jgi:hypothetical protein
MDKKKPIKMKAALNRMRELTRANIPFSFGYIKYNETTATSGGYKNVPKGLLRPGYNKNTSKKANILIAYKDETTNKNRQFYMPLLLMFNGHPIIP